MNQPNRDVSRAISFPESPWHRTAIAVTAGPGPLVSVSDDAGLLLSHPSDTGGDRSPDPSGIGLEIVRRIMRLHRGSLDISVDPQRRTTMLLNFGTTHGGTAM